MTHGHDSKPVRRASNFFDATPFAAHLSTQMNPRDSQTALHNLIQPNDLSVVFQPIVHADTFAIFAYEALLRCKVPQFASPPVLFEHALQQKCVGRLGRMIREVAFPNCANSPLFVNVHPRELEERWIVQPDDPMYFHNHTVYVEITESVPMTHFALCRDVLRELRSQAGVHLVVDDLGAGYSNLNRIADLEPAVVKLDKALIQDIAIRMRTHKLVSNVVRLCVDLGAKVVAEGIETLDVALALRDAGVHMFQGFYFARPGFPLPTIEREALQFARKSS